jgi:hypothetical protein
MSDYKSLWLRYMEDIISPMDFVEAGYWFMISAALQRRVWLGDLNNPIFPNQYCVFCAPPGVGKSIVSTHVAKLLGHHKKVRKISKILEQTAKSPADASETFKDLNMPEDDPILSQGPDSTSFELLVNKMSVETQVFKPQAVGEVKPLPYVHSSMYWLLDEFTNLFDEHSERISTFFTSTWMGTTKYKRETIGRGRDYITNPCLSLIAGTTPDNMQDLQRKRIIKTGLARRIFIVYSDANRKNLFQIPSLRDDQLEAFEQLTYFIGNLINAYGPLSFSPQALGFLQEWWDEHTKDPTRFNPYTVDYEMNKNVHVMKLAMAFHFNYDPNSKVISEETAKRTVDYISKVDSHRHKAFAGFGRNELIGLIQGIYKFLMLHTKPIPRAAVISKFLSEGNVNEIDTALKTLLDQEVLNELEIFGKKMYAVKNKQATL